MSIPPRSPTLPACYSCTKLPLAALAPSPPAPFRMLRRRKGVPGRLASLLPKAQLLDDDLVAVERVLFQVLQQGATLVDQLEHAPAAGVVLHVRLEMLAQLVDALGQQGHLDLGRAGVAVVHGVLLDEFRLLVLQQSHFTSSWGAPAALDPVRGRHRPRRPSPGSPCFSVRRGAPCAATVRNLPGPCLSGR